VEVALRHTLSRAKRSELVAQLPPCSIGMEACSGAHEWARRFSAAGHRVRPMAAKFVMPYRKSGRNDGSDAEGICATVGRPTMRLVPVKSLEATFKLKTAGTGTRLVMTEQGAF
jgi:transposase